MISPNRKIEDQEKKDTKNRSVDDHRSTILASIQLSLANLDSTHIVRDARGTAAHSSQYSMYMYVCIAINLGSFGFISDLTCRK